MNVPVPLERKSVMLPEVVNGGNVLVAVPVCIRHGDVHPGES